MHNFQNLDHPSIPTDLCVLDWQLARISSPALDLSYFIFTCTDKKLRDKYYDKMLKTYHYSLCLQLTMLGSDPSLFPFEALEEEMKSNSISGLFAATMVLFLMVAEVGDIPDYNNATAEDFNVDMANMQVKTLLSYTARITDVVKDFIRNGYLDYLM